MLRQKEIEEKLELGEKAAGYKFKNHKLLLEALTHRSYANEARNKAVKDNDRLEFLGDAILDIIVAEKLYNEFPDLNSGEMTKFRADLVNEFALASIATKNGLGDALLLGVGEARSGGAEKNSVLSDAYEAMVAAVFTDGGFDVAKKMVMRDMKIEMVNCSEHIGERDFKSVLQEVCAKRHWNLPRYTVLGCSGPDHATEYSVKCFIGERDFCTGVGRSIKLAEQDVASRVLCIIEEEESAKRAANGASHDK